jgi:hypothetical protein
MGDDTVSTLFNGMGFADAAGGGITRVAEGVGGDKDVVLARRWEKEEQWMHQNALAKCKRTKLTKMAGHSSPGRLNSVSELRDQMPSH